MKYAIENFTEILPQIQELVPSHGAAAEIKDLNVDYSLFKTMDKNGILICYTARLQEKLVGYIIGIIVNDIHRKHIRQVSFQDYYVISDYRKSGVAIHMFRSLENYLYLNNKVDEMHVTSKLKYDRLFELLGWILSDHLFTKKLEAKNV